MSNKFKKTAKALKSIQFAKAMKDLKLASPEIPDIKSKQQKSPDKIDFSQLFFRDLLSNKYSQNFIGFLDKSMYEKSVPGLNLILPGITNNLNRTAFKFIDSLLELRPIPGRQSSLIQNFMDAEAEYCIENDFYLKIDKVPNEAERNKLLASISPYVVFGQDLNYRNRKKYIWDELNSFGRSMYFSKVNKSNYSKKQIYGFKVEIFFENYDLSLKKHIRDPSRPDILLMKSNSDAVVELNLEMDSDDSSASLFVMDINQKFGYPPSKFAQK